VLSALGRFCYRRRRIVLIATFVVTVAAAAWGSGVFAALGGGGYNDPTAESTKTVNLLEREFGRAGTEDVTVIYTNPAPGGTIDDPAFAGRIRSTVDALPREHVAQAVTYWTPGLDERDRAERVSKDRRSTKVTITLAGTTENARYTDYQEIKDRLHIVGVETNITGQVAGIDQLTEAAGGDAARAEMVAFPILLVLLVLVFRGLIAGLLPLLLGVLSIIGATVLLRLISGVTDVSVLALNIATFLGLGLAIDYGLFVVSRFREELDRGRDVRSAIAATMASAGRTVAFSGLIIAIAFSGMLFFRSPAYRSFGWGGIAVVIFDVLAALVVLPAVLSALGHRVNKFRVPLPRRRPQGAHGSREDQGWWAAVGRTIMRRPLLSLLAGGAVMVVAALPVLSLQPGIANHRYLPPGSEDIVASRMLENDFPNDRGTHKIEIAVLGDVARADLDAYAARLDRLEGAHTAEIRAVKPGIAHVQVGAVGEPDTPTNLDLGRSVRDMPPPPGATGVMVGGLAPAVLDSFTAVSEYAPMAVLFVCALTFVLLLLAFGSVVLPLKALLAAFLSLGASVGVIVWGMQEGHLAGPLGFEAPGTTDPSNLMIILLIVFGLATDYELFLLSRIREEYQATGDNARSVAAGLQRTGVIITSAALLLAVVLGAMGLLSSGLVLTTMGIGMTVGIIVDATLVRMVLVPSTMRLLGGANWWLPGPLRRLHGRIGLAHEGTAVETGRDARPEEAPVGPGSTR